MGGANNKQAERLLKLFDAAKPISKWQRGCRMIGGGGDHPRPQGLVRHVFFQPFVWPKDSETHLVNDSDTVLDESKSMRTTRWTPARPRTGCSNGGSWVGECCGRCSGGLQRGGAIKFNQAEISRVASGLFKRASRMSG